MLTDSTSEYLITASVFESRSVTLPCLDWPMSFDDSSANVGDVDCWWLTHIESSLPLAKTVVVPEIPCTLPKAVLGVLLWVSVIPT